MRLFSFQDNQLPEKNSSESLSRVQNWWLMKFQLDFEKNRRRAIENLVPNARDSLKALDVGCAIGVFTDLLRQKGYETVGVDANEELLSFAQKKYLCCEFRLMDALHLEFPSSYFDFVLALELIEHLENPYKLLEGIHRILKDDGAILLSTPNKLSLEGARGKVMEDVAKISWNAWDEEHKHIYTSTEIVRLLSRFFKIEKVAGYYYLPMIPSMKYDIVKKIGLDRTHYLTFDNRILSMLGFITFVKGVKRKSDSSEHSSSSSI
jgi:2-polyprenyl-3-methyl-5-hydroxy-6-metoxy-1,4-benzoquinol methylase